MTYDARIILAGQQPDIVGALAQGTRAAGMANEVSRQNALANIYKTDGAGIAAGDPDALNRLATVAPFEAQQSQMNRLGMQRTQQVIRHSEETLQMAREQAKREGQRLAMEMTAQERERQAAVLENALAQVVAAETPEQFDAIMAAHPDTEQFVGQFAEKERLIAGAVGLTEALKMAAPPEPPASVQEYQYGQTDPGYLDYQREKAAAGASKVYANSNPAPPAGYRNVYDNDGNLLYQEPVPGGPAEREAKEAALEAAGADAKRSEGDRQTRIKLGTTLRSMNDNIKEIEDGGWPVLGPIGALSRFIPGTAASDFGVNTNQITDAAALQEISEMRQNSPTGGAVGSLTDGERVALGQARTAISTAQSEEAYLKAIKNYRNVMLDIAYKGSDWEIDEETGEVIVTPKIEGGGDIPAGVTPEEWQFMSPEDRALWK